MNVRQDSADKKIKMPGKNSAAIPDWLLTARNFVEKRLLLFTRDLPDESFWFKNYFIATEEYFHEAADKNTSNIKLVQISDLHLRCIGPALKKAVNNLNTLKPDLILFTGDVIN